MAGSAVPGDPSDNPVPINVTAMVDIIFCLCIFFFCSFSFRIIEPTIQSWLPRDRGVNLPPLPLVQVEEVRIFLDLERKGPQASLAVVRRVGSERVDEDGQLRQALGRMKAEFKKQGVSDPPVLIDSDPLVPWREVVKVLGLCRSEGMARIELARSRA